MLQLIVLAVIVDFTAVSCKSYCVFSTPSHKDTNIFVIAQKYYGHFTFLNNIALAFFFWLHMKISISLYFLLTIKIWYTILYAASLMIDVQIEKLQAALNDDEACRFNFASFEPIPLPLDPEVVIRGIVPENASLFKVSWRQALA